MQILSLKNSSLHQYFTNTLITIITHDIGEEKNRFCVVTSLSGCDSDGKKRDNTKQE